MLHINNITVQFGGRYLFDNISFTVNPSERIGLIGRNGTGKTTLLRIIYNDFLAEEGQITYPKDYKISYLPQEMKVESDNNLFNYVKESLVEIFTLQQTLERITDELAIRTDYETESYHKLATALAHDTYRFQILGGLSIDAEIEKTLKGLGFSKEDLSRQVNEFSGGWKMRIELAKLLLQKPDVLLLDEPTNHLDIQSIIWIENFLKNYFGAVLLVSHDKKFLDNITNRTIEISQAKIFDMKLRYSDFIIEREVQKEHLMSSYKNQQREIAQTERFIERFRSKATLATRVQSRIKQLDKIERIELEDEDISAMKIQFPEPPRAGRIVAETKKLSKTYGSKLVLENIDFAIEREEKIAFVGKNGEGKSTLSKILAGRTEYDGQLIFGNNVQISYYSQNTTEDLNLEKTVFQTIDDCAKNGTLTSVRSLLGAFLFSGDAQDKKVKVLSGGEKSRLALAKLIMEPSNLLILDEPTNHLDIISKEVLKKALLLYKGALIIVSHDRDFLDGLVNKTIEFKNKSIKEFSGGIYDYLNKYEQEIENENKEINLKINEFETKTEAKVSWEKRKDINRKIEKVKRELVNCEKDIENIENQINKIELKFNTPDYYLSVDFEQTNLNYHSLQKNLEELMLKWESLDNELTEINTDE